MRHETRRVPTDGATGGHASAALDIRDLKNAAVLVAATGVGPTGANADAFSVKLQATIKGSLTDDHGVWVDVTGAIVGDTIVPLDRAATTDIGGYAMPFTHIRTFITTKGTVPPKVLVAGYNTRTH